MPSPVRDRARLRSLRALALLLLLVGTLLSGCLRVQANITVSRDDLVSGSIIAAVKQRDEKDKGPQFEENVGFPQKITISSYRDKDFVGSKATFTDLTFAELPQLANLSRDATGVDISLRRVGNLVILEGRADLTTLSDPDADVKFAVQFPGEVTSTNGERRDTTLVEWRLKPAAVTTMNAQARFTDPSTRSFTAAAVWLGLSACLVAGIIAALAWRDHDRTSPRFAAVERGADPDQEGPAIPRRD